MSKSLKSINKGPSLSERMSAAFSGAADTGKNAIAKLSGKGTPELNADKTNSMVTVAPGQELSTIASIIATWNENGVPVVGPVKQDKTKPINAYRI
jgi:protein-disulfide isomerase-like protein with CxxC motif